jgi:predicted RNA-binding Zn ribbon-like protein
MTNLIIAGAGERRAARTTRTEPEPGRRTPAPGALLEVQRFVNTRDVEAGTDELTSPDALAAWLAEHGLPGAGAPVTEDDLARALGVREALRALALANNGEPLPPEALATLNRASERARLAVRFDRAGTASLEPAAGGVDAALAWILAAVQRAELDGTWRRIKACRNHTCEWVFYDRSRNRSGTWCTMAVCGNLMKARAYRRRRASSSTPA